MLKVYGFSKVNAVARGNTHDLRVLWGLEEMQLPFELVGMDDPAHNLNTAGAAVRFIESRLHGHDLFRRKSTGKEERLL